MSLKTSEEITLKIPASARKLLLISAIAMGTLIFRIVVSRQLFGFRFLIWNLILAWIPWIISYFLTQKNLNRIVLGIGTAIWVLFLPNAPYIVTDLVHIRPDVGAPIEVEMLMLFSFGFAGLIIGYSSVQMMENAFLPQLEKWPRRIVLAVFWIAVSYGVYIGRFMRKNSWDILGDPLKFLAEVLIPFIKPFEHKHAISFTLVFGAIIMMGYFILRHTETPKSISESGGE